jgi:hypothetical protein
MFLCVNGTTPGCLARQARKKAALITTAVICKATKPRKAGRNTVHRMHTYTSIKENCMGRLLATTAN